MDMALSQEAIKILKKRSHKVDAADIPAVAELVMHGLVHAYDEHDLYEFPMCERTEKGECFLRRMASNS